MYRLATLNDMVELVAWKRRQGEDLAPPWGLKQFGTLFMERHIVGARPAAVLEAGVGFTTHFHDFVDPSTEYWTVDRPGFYDSELFGQGLSRRHRARHVEGLLGDFSPDLPESHFDLTFSISALEHTDSSEAPAVCRDLYRITQPSGYSIHTIDTPAHSPDLRLRPWHDAFAAAGFEFTEPSDLAFGPRGINGLAVLVEPLDVHVLYFRERLDFWDSPYPLRDHQVTIVVVARRPHHLSATPGGSIEQEQLV